MQIVSGTLRSNEQCQKLKQIKHFVCIQHCSHSLVMAAEPVHAQDDVVAKLPPQAKPKHVDNTQLTELAFVKEGHVLKERFRCDKRLNAAAATGQVFLFIRLYHLLGHFIVVGWHRHQVK